MRVGLKKSSSGKKQNPGTVYGDGLCCFTVRTSMQVHGTLEGFPGSSALKDPAATTGDPGSIPGSGRSPGGGHGSPLQCSGLGSPMPEEPGGVQSLGSQRVRHDLATKQQTFKARDYILIEVIFLLVFKVSSLPSAGVAAGAALRCPLWAPQALQTTSLTYFYLVK